ncbi:hypothetical protein LRS04_02745 [Phenylobacterium sp. J367]|nr:hypothetical protein [Phenylobacterium sp. J367]
MPRLRKVVDTRAETIAGALAEARRVQAEADAQAAAAQAEIAQGRAEARRVASEAQAKAAAEFAARQAAEDQRLAVQMDEAEARIRAMRDQAMGNVDGIATDTAQAIIQKLTGAAPSAAEIKAMAVRQGAV